MRLTSSPVPDRRPGSALLSRPDRSSTAHRHLKPLPPHAGAGTEAPLSGRGARTHFRKLEASQRRPVTRCLPLPPSLPSLPYRYTVQPYLLGCPRVCRRWTVRRRASSNTRAPSFCCLKKNCALPHLALPASSGTAQCGGTREQAGRGARGRRPHRRQQLTRRFFLFLSSSTAGCRLKKQKPKTKKSK